ncbi:helix-turn-helix domain-containing protein [Paracoccus subflavus]|uniref:Helix-turn-helix domain-containing protein n=1 Tax=Paracoccus subflavus TaxID=2528244 RepID=A0A4Q9FXR7_9RHOB|nr:helix-turn-helix domain-containing protein [Paracoccus subflavus]TBN38627.1 helix-turn-helix domain-containing protein [Paracoccus subflavus]
MSHAATNWAIQQRGLKPTTKIVLWHLCDRFNPDYGCFPSQARLAEDCEISRSTLNDHLDRLEVAQLLRRVARVDPVTKRQMPTRYILGFEEGIAPRDPEPCPESGHGDLPFVGDGDPSPRSGDPADPCPEIIHGIGVGAVSDFHREPCPENTESRVRISDTNLVREPLREPVKEEEDAQAREADFDRFFAELLGALGLDLDATLPAWWQGWPARLHVRRWIDDLGLTEDRIIEIATATRRDHPDPPDGPKALDRAMERAARRDAQIAADTGGRKSPRRGKRDAGPRPSTDELAAFYAELVNSDRYLPANTISNTMRVAMLSRGLVTAERLRARGVR